MLQRQEKIGPCKQFSVRAPQALAQDLEDYAYANRKTQSAVVTLLLKKALKAEEGELYVPEKRKEATT